MTLPRAIIIVSALAFLPVAPVYAQSQYNPIQQQAAQGDRFAVELLQWLDAARDQNPSFQTIQTVVSQHPDWPLQGDFKVKADRAIIKGGGPASTILSWYQNNTPSNDEAKLIYLKTLAGAQENQKLATALKTYWRGGAFDSDTQAYILSQWGTVLSEDDQYARADYLVESGNAARAEVAIGYVMSIGDKNLLATRLLLLKGSDEAEKAYQTLTKQQKNSAPTVYARLKFLRETRQNEKAAAFLAENKKSPIGYADQWWKERHILARRAFEEKRYQDAYYLAADHGFDEGIAMADGEWLSGWIALKYLNRPDLAFGHFDTMYKKVKTPLSKSRAGYGAGLASAALNENAIAKRWYEVTGQYVQTFYGQKALEKIGTRDQVMKVTFQAKSDAAQLNEIIPSAGTIRALNDMSAFKAAEYLHNAGFEKERDLFLLSLVWKIKETDQLEDLLNICKSMKSQTAYLSLGKRLYDMGVVEWDALFPTLDFKLDPIINPALTHAIIRQESLFNPNIESRAGAKGLMQLMPATASAEAVRLGISHDTAWLFSKPEHNVRLGQSYLSRMLDRYDGSMPLAVAAYNAGPGNVDKWLTTIGDPRVSGDDLEWMEKIPFKETRNYVQRVLESYTVYQNKL